MRWLRLLVQGELEKANVAELPGQEVEEAEEVEEVEEVEMLEMVEYYLMYISLIVNEVLQHGKKENNGYSVASTWPVLLLCLSE